MYTISNGMKKNTRNLIDLSKLKHFKSYDFN